MLPRVNAGASGSFMGVQYESGKGSGQPWMVRGPLIREVTTRWNVLDYTPIFPFIPS